MIFLLVCYQLVFMFTHFCKISYTTKFFEMMALPSCSFKLEPIMQLGEKEQEQLKHLRGERSSGDALVIDEDEAVGEMKPEEQHFYIKERVEADNHADPNSPFWLHCYGWCEPDQPRFEGTNIGGEHEIDELLGGHVPARISGALCHCHARQNADKVTVGVHVVRDRGPLQRSTCRGRPTL